jgi:Tfp pilus assembly protein PilF
MKRFIRGWLVLVAISGFAIAPTAVWASHGGGGHGGGGGGHMGGGHMGGGGHHGGFSGGGFHGGFSGGHHGGFSGGHIGGYSGSHHGGFIGSNAGAYSGHSGFSGSHLGTTFHSGTAGTLGRGHSGTTGSNFGTSNHLHSGTLHNGTLNGGSLHSGSSNFLSRHGMSGTHTSLGNSATHLGTHSYLGNSLSHPGSHTSLRPSSTVGGSHSNFLGRHGLTNVGASNFATHAGLNHGANFTHANIASGSQSFSNLGHYHYNPGGVHHASNWNGHNYHYNPGGYGHSGYGNYGYGHHGYGHHWGYGPRYGFGYGLGYGGWGYGLGYGFGYPYGYGWYGFRPYYGYGYGYPLWSVLLGRVLFGGWGYGYGGYGYGGYPYYGYGSYYPSYGYGGYGYTNVGGYGTTNVYSTPAVVDLNSGATAAAPALGDYVAQGDADFKAGDYAGAARDWQHALVDDPNNAGIMLLLGQALFATGKYDEAAGVLQAGMAALPQDKWGTVVSNYTDLYPSNTAYTNQLRALEAAAEKEPNSPALRFLLGYHYGYLGYPKQAITQLDKTLQLAPQDTLARQLRDVMNAKANPAAAPTAPPINVPAGNAPAGARVF